MVLNRALEHALISAAQGCDRMVASLPATAAVTSGELSA